MTGTRPPLADLLDLSPHPEGGWYRRTWTSTLQTTSSSPAGHSQGSRATASAIYYLLSPGEESAWHRVRSDELWMWHHGGPLTITLGGTRGRPDEPGTSLLLGAGLATGQRPQIVVPAGTWQAARPMTGSCLVSCVVSPEFHFDDFELLATAKDNPTET
jgi:uncharacterized protein